MANFNYQAVANTVADNITNRQDAAAAGNFLSTALQVYQKHLLDTQADQINAAQNAQPATAITDANGNPVYGDGTSASAPPTTDQEQAENSALGYGFNENPTPPAAGGVAGLQMRMALAKNQAQVGLQQNRAAHLQSMMNGTAQAPDPLDDAIKRARLAKLTAPANAAAMTPGQQGVQNRFDTRQAYLQRQSDLTAQDKWFKQNTGVGAESWGNWANPRLVDAQGNQASDGTFFAADAPDGKGGTIPLKIPASTYQQGQQRLQAYNALKTAPIAPAASVAPAPAATGTAPVTSSADDQALAWAQSNPNDPRSSQILQRLGLQ